MIVELSQQAQYNVGEKPTVLSPRITVTYPVQLSILYYVFPPDWGMIRSSRRVQVFLQTVPNVLTFSPLTGDAQKV